MWSCPSRSPVASPNPPTLGPGAFIYLLTKKNLDKNQQLISLCDNASQNFFMKKYIPMIQITDATWIKWADEVISLSSKQQQKWKNGLRLGDGNRMVVRFDGARFYCMRHNMRVYIECRTMAAEISKNKRIPRDCIANTDDDLRQHFWQQVAETSTGNHYRNHMISVPTAPGQPVRG